MRRFLATHLRGITAVLLFLFVLYPLLSRASDEIVIRVNDLEVTRSQFEYSFSQAARNRFYHGTPPQEQVASMRDEVVENIINRIVLVKEAERLGIEPDSATVQSELDKIIANSAGHQVDAEILRRAIIDQKRAQMLERRMRQVAAAAQDEVKEYYQHHPEKFTEPERVRLSLILLKVVPSAPEATWVAARVEGKGLLEELESGGDFAELARLHSSDPSANSGGDMGYLHKGMLNQTVQQAVDDLEPGQISAPVTVLEGIALFRLDERQPAALLPLAQVKDRAAKLLNEERSEQNWKDFLARIKAQSDIEINTEILAHVAINHID